MRWIILCVITFLVFACTSEKGRIKKRVATKPHRAQTKSNVQASVQVKKNINLPRLLSPAFLGKLVPPIITNSKDQSEMTLVNPEHYRDSSSIFAAKETVNLSAFYIDRHETSVAQFQMFRPDYSETIFTENKTCPDCPAMAIDWKSAEQYCRWAGKRLPSEVEWEAAAKGSTDNLWPWGNRFYEKYTNALGENDGFTGPAPVGSFPAGTSFFGVSDMTGNVWEWVSDEVPGSSEQEPIRRIVKGGGWRSKISETTINFQNVVSGDLQNPTFGFRCAKNLR